jgi:Paraquat-inducible protein A
VLWLYKLFIPVLILVTHYGFYYGQSAVMWKLVATIEYDVAYQVTTTRTRALFDTVGLPLSEEYDHPRNVTDLQQFTYTYAIQGLWEAKQMTGPIVLPRLAAVLLIVFSGIWPHMKLFLLLTTWLFVTDYSRRKRILNVLSVLGKWSLADVLVVCVMVGVLNLSWTFTTKDVLDHVHANLYTVSSIVREAYTTENICSAALHYSCDHPRNIIRGMLPSCSTMLQHPVVAPYRCT